VVSVSTAKSTQDLWQLTEAQKKQIKESWMNVLTKEKQNPNPAQRGSSLFFELRVVENFQHHTNTQTQNSNFATHFVSFQMFVVHFMRFSFDDTPTRRVCSKTRDYKLRLVH
jgi:hypothetical protein